MRWDWPLPKKKKIDKNKSIYQVMKEVEICRKCHSDAIDIVNSFGEEVYVECRDCETKKIIYPIDV